MISGIFYFHNRNSSAVFDIKYDFGDTRISNFIFPHDKTHNILEDGCEMEKTRSVP